MNPIVKINCIELSWNDSKEKVLEWDNLLIESDFPHPFSSFTFYNSWVETFVDDLTQIKMLFFYNNNKLVGLAPIFVDQDNKSVSILGDKDLFDYRDIIYISEFYEEIYFEFLSYLKSQKSRISFSELGSWPAKSLQGKAKTHNPLLLYKSCNF